MGGHTLYYLQIWQICVILFTVIIIFAYLGYFAGRRSRKKKAYGDTSDGSVKKRSVSASVRPAIGTLLALIMGFTFGMAGQRYTGYKKAIVEEVNCIRTAGSYIDLYPEAYRTEFRKYFSDYIQARISLYDAGTVVEMINESEIRSDEAGKRLSELSARLFRDIQTISASRIMSPAINEMLDAGKSRVTSLMSKVPFEIVLMIAFLTFVVIFLVGYESERFKKKEAVQLILYAAVITLVIFIILDLDRPDSGLIKPSVEHEAMIELSRNF